MTMNYVISDREQYSLLSNSAREFLFCSQFFGVKDTRAYELFKSVMVGHSLTMTLMSR